MTATSIETRTNELDSKLESVCDTKIFGELSLDFIKEPASDNRIVRCDLLDSIKPEDEFYQPEDDVFFLLR